MRFSSSSGALPRWRKALTVALATGAVTCTGSSTSAYADVQVVTENIADTAVEDVKNRPGSLGGGLGKVKNALPGPDFLAVIDATQGSPTYGKVVNTATVGPLVENEPHHLQYAWHEGDTIYAGALFAAATYAYWVLKDGARTWAARLCPVGESRRR